MSYNTGNPVPSKDPRDLVDNAENLDRAVNGEALTFDDRLGKQRKSWAGMEQDFADFLASSGFEPVHLVYQDGVALTVDRPTQLIDYSGSVYRVKMPSDFPVSLSGTWATDSALLVDIGDQSLRQELASPSGAAMVGRGAMTVASIADLVALPEGLRKADLSYCVVGYHAGSTVGGGEFVWSGSSTLPADDVTVFAVNGVATGRWLRLVKNNTLSVHDFGYLDSLGDNSAAITRMVSYLTETADACFVSGLESLRQDFADVAQKMLTGQVLTISAVGDSITYGSETGGGGAPINGSTAERAVTPWPETVGYALIQQGYPAIVTNRGYPGDRADQGLSRWPTGSGGADVVYIMYGTNDAKENTTADSPFQSVDAFRGTLTRHVQREQAQGSYVVLCVPPMAQQEDTTRQYRMRAYSDVIRDVARNTGADVVDMAEALQNQPDVFGDPLHPRARGLNEMGYSAAAHLLAFQHDLPVITPYLDCSPQFNPVALGAPVIRDTTYNLSQVYKLSANDSIWIAGRFTEDMVALITTVEHTATASTLAAVVSGGGSRQGDTSSLTNNGSNADGRASFYSPILKKGARFLRLQCNSGLSVIERIQFVPASTVLPGYGSEAAYRSTLSGYVLSPTSPTYTAVIDPARQLRERFVVEAKLTLPDVSNKLSGIGLSSSVRVNEQGAPDKYVLFGRINNNLFVRRHDSGTSTDTTITGVFTAGADDVTIKVVCFLDNAEIFVNGASAGTITGIIGYTSRCWPMLINSVGNEDVECKWLRTS